MLNGAFHRAVAATLVDVDVRGSDAARDDVVDFVAGQLGALPLHLAVGVTAASLLLAAGTVATRGRSLRALPLATRARVVEQWSTSSFAPARLYVRLVRSLVLYSAHEMTSVSA